MTRKDNLKKRYVRSVIKLGNSKAITFPQEWTNQAHLVEKSEVNLYPIDNKSIIIRTRDDDEEEETVLRIDSKEWPLKLMKQALISAFKLNTDKIFIKYYPENESLLYELLIESRKEIIGLDFKNLPETNEFFVNFLLDTRKTTFYEVLIDLANVFNTIISHIIEGRKGNFDDLLLAEIDRKYSLGTRILITGLSEYPYSKGFSNLPVIHFLGNRVILLYTRDFINASLNLQNLPTPIIQKYAPLLSRIPDLLIQIIHNYEKVSLELISQFQDYLTSLHERFEKIEVNDGDGNELRIRNIINYFLSIFDNFFDIGITRLIESDIGMT
ncbi:MAG: AbrB/MazE/SpoVT family DNA-binding domain-containing protein [Promethearchaeota archaeon]